MSAVRVVILILLTLPVFLIIDGIWLGVMSKAFYAPRIGHLMAPGVNWVAAALFYLLFVVGVVLLAVVPGLQMHSGGLALMRGALVGLVAYGTYDLTNLATLRDWPIAVTLVDLIWGTFLAAATASAGYRIGLMLWR